MTSLVIGAGGLLLVLGGLLALLAWATGEDAVAVLVIAAGSVVVTAIITFFSFLLAYGLEEVFSNRA